MKKTPNHEYKKSTIIRQGADIKKSDPNSHYVDNARFYEELVKRKAAVDAALAAGLPKPRVSEYVGKCLLEIANRLSSKYYFRDYPFREDMVCAGVEHMLRYIDSFDVSYTSNPFSYMTQTAYYFFINYIRAEKKRLADKFKFTLDALATQEVSAIDDPDYALLIAEENLPDVGYMSEFVNSFDKSEEERKSRQKEQKKKASDPFAINEDVQDNGDVKE